MQLTNKREGFESMPTERNQSIFWPRKITYDTTLTASARLLYGVIFTQAYATGYCYAVNQELGDSLSLSQKRVSALISELVNHGYISREIRRDPKTNEVLERKLYPLVR